MPRRAPAARSSSKPLAMFVVAALLPLVIFSAATSIVTLQQKRAELEQNALSETQRLGALIDAELNRTLDVLVTLARSPRLDEPANLAAFEQILRREVNAQPLWMAGIVTDPDGNALIHTLLPIPRRVVDLPSLKRAIELRRPVIGTVLMGQAGDPGIALRAPVVRDGETRLVVSAAIRPDGIRELLLGSRLPPAAVGTVIDGQGHIVARTQGDPALVGAEPSPTALAARARGGAGLYEGRLIEGLVTVSAYSVSPATGWSVHIGIPRSDFDAPVRRGFWIAVVGGVVSLLLAGVFILLLVRELRHRRLAEHAREQAARLEGLGRLTGGVAHDFNNLLAVILGSVELLERRRPDLKGHRSLAAIRNASQRGVEITQSLLVFSRGGPVRRTVVDINTCLREVLGMVRDAMPPRIVVEADLRPGLPTIALDRVQFDLGMLNLASNARDAMPDGGTIRIISHLAETSGGSPTVAVTVADTGTGIPPEVQKHIFEPFFTTKEVGQGTGLGLAQIHGFVEAMGGHILVDSQPGLGTRITLVLPASGEDVSSPATPERPASQGAAGSGGR